MTKTIPCHLDKHQGSPELLKLEDASVRNLNTLWGGTVTARYYKGVGADGDNLVIVVKSEASLTNTVNAEQFT